MPVSSRHPANNAYGSPLRQAHGGNAPPSKSKDAHAWGQPSQGLAAGSSGTPSSGRISQRLPLLHALFRGLSPSSAQQGTSRWAGSPAQAPASPKSNVGSPHTPTSPRVNVYPSHARNSPSTAALAAAPASASSFHRAHDTRPSSPRVHAPSAITRKNSMGSRGSHVSASVDSSVGLTSEDSNHDAQWAATPLVSRILGTPRRAPTPPQNMPSTGSAYPPPSTPPASHISATQMLSTPNSSTGDASAGGRRRALSASSSVRRPSLHPVAEFNSTSKLSQPDTPQLVAGLPNGGRSAASSVAAGTPGTTPLSFTLSPRGFGSVNNTPVKATGSPSAKDAQALAAQQGLRWRNGDNSSSSALLQHFSLLSGAQDSVAGSERSTPVHKPQSQPYVSQATPQAVAQKLNLYSAVSPASAASPVAQAPAGADSPMAKPSKRGSAAQSVQSLLALGGHQSPSLLTAAAQRVRDEYDANAKERRVERTRQAAQEKQATQTPVSKPQASGVLQTGRPAGGYTSSTKTNEEMLVSSQLSAPLQKAVKTHAHGQAQRHDAKSAAAPLAEPRKEERQERREEKKEYKQVQGRTVPPHISNMVCLWTANGQEDQAKYGEAGYMRIRKGMVLGKRYHVISKLGWGEFATVWLCWDQESLKKKIQNPTQQFVAVKVSKCGEHVSNAAIEEANLLKYIGKHARGSGAASLATVLNVFNQAGDHGNHICMVFPVLGQNILCLVEQAHRYRSSIRGVTSASQCPKRAPEDVAFVKSCLRACLRALHELHRNAIVHTDLKPENVLLTTVSKKTRGEMREWQEAVAKVRGTPWDGDRMVNAGDVSEEGQLSYIRVSDFGLSSLLDPEAKNYGVGTHARRLHCADRGVASNPLGVILQTREYRAPEVLFGNKVAPCTDVWSVGCMAFELVTGTFLMDPKKDPKKRVKSEEEINTDHLCMMSQLIGRVPSNVATAGGKHLRKYFDSEGRFYQQEKSDKCYPPRCLKSELRFFLDDKDAALMASFVVQCLGTYDATTRATAGEVLKHPFLAY